jgi:hypothetical protein
VREEFAGKARDVLADRAEFMRKRLADFGTLLPVRTIELGSTARLPGDYVAGHALGCSYALDALPTEATLRTDLQNVVRAYRALTFRGGIEGDAEPQAELEDEFKIPAQATIIETRQYAFHRKVERNRTAAKQAKKFHGTRCQACELDFEERYASLLACSLAALVEPRFANLASLYQHIGQCVARPPEKCVGVRWDYAFFQMLIETNYLTFHRPDGAPGGVPARDNNFAGVGATVPGKPGEHFNDPATGVLAHLQHVLMYSTTRIPNPVAHRTRQVQDDVQEAMRRLQRPVTFTDLAREWTGTDKNSYAAEMQKMAEKYAAHFCRAQTREDRASLR